jgi:hypothetical protein
MMRWLLQTCRTRRAARLDCNVLSSGMHARKTFCRPAGWVPFRLQQEFSMLLAGACASCRAGPPLSGRHP